jgi:hypothetical protein
MIWMLENECSSPSISALCGSHIHHVLRVIARPSVMINKSSINYDNLPYGDPSRNDSLLSFAEKVRRHTILSRSHQSNTSHSQSQIQLEHKNPAAAAMKIYNEKLASRREKYR